MSKDDNCKICCEFDNNDCCVSVRHMISLSKTHLLLLKSTKWLFNDLIFRNDMVGELLCNCSVLLTDKLLSDCTV